MQGVAGLTDDTVRAAAEGSREDLSRLLEALQTQVRLMVAARLSPTPAQLHAVDDTAQLVMTALSEGIARLERRTVAGLRAYASGIVARKVADLLRGRGEGGKQHPLARSLDSTVTAFSHAGGLWQLLSASDTTPRSAADRAEQVAILLRELGQLKAEYRQIITLAFFDQLPMAEIAEQLDKSRPAASMLLIRAVRALRRNMIGTSTIGHRDGQAPGT